MARTEIIRELEELLKLRKEEPTQILAKALHVGLHEMLRQSAIDDYLKQKISRSHAIKLASLDLVKRAERERKAVQEDIEWGLGA